MSQEQPTPETQDHFQPKGTVLIMILFVATLIILWGSVYLTMLSQGATGR